MENLEQMMKSIDSKVCGVNKECIYQYYENISKEPIDFNLISIDWLIFTMIADFYGGADINSSLSDCLVEEEFFCDSLSKKIGVSNPLIYHFAMTSAKDVTAPIVTLHSRIEYYNNVLSELQLQFDNSLDDKERNRIQSKMDYLESEIEKLRASVTQL